jgi:hypothetical protein
MDRGPRSEQNLKERYLVRKMPLNLNDQLALKAMNLLATPQATDGTSGSVIGKDDKFIQLPSGRMRKVNRNGIDGSVGLAREISLLPTRTAEKISEGERSHMGALDNFVAYQTLEVGTKTGLKLQPAFVEWMMGYPSTWTDLNSPKQDTESKD